MIRAAASRARLALFAGLIAGVGACTNEKVVYRDVGGPTPPENAGGFVGYAKLDTKQTACGNCHIDLQTSWVQTGHAKAWADLQASGHAGSSCQDCHAVSGLGNGTATSVAYSATKDPRYQDVQCENCHGAGQTHINNPGPTHIPLASIAVAVDSGSKFSCAACHTGTHEPFVDQWKASAHAAFSSETEAGCIGCHTGQGALTAWGVQTNYVEKGSTTYQPITCAVCHDPHADKQDHQLRFSIVATDTSKNLCMKCHNRRGAVDWTSTRNSSHAPEAATLLGYAGWFPTGYMTSPDQGGKVIATHGSAANPGLCATCHVARMTVNDATGNFVFQATGHTFDATPCTNAKGVPIGGTCDISQKTFASCAGSGCHGSAAAARSALVTATDRINTLITTLNAQLAKVPSSAKSGTAPSVARGALFNASVAKAGNGNDVSGAVAHNPFLVEQLLTNSIKAVQATYGIAPNTAVDLSTQLGKH